MEPFWLFTLASIQLVAVASTIICDAEDALKLYPCEELEGDVDISAWFENGTDGKMRKNAEKLISAKGKMTIRQTNASRLDFPKLRDVDHLEIIDNPQLTKINVPNLKQIGKLTITGNPRLLYKKLKSLKHSTISDMRNSTVECLTSEKDAFSSADHLKLCTIIKGPLIIRKAEEGFVGSQLGYLLGINWEKKLNIKEIHGCIHVEETGLYNLDFLKETNISGCLGHHVITNNSNLCPPLFLEENSGTKVVITGSQRPYGCGKVCKSLSEGNCNIIRHWELKITSETKPEDVAELEMVHGPLSIVDTTLESFEFPKLTVISGAIGPMLIVKNNPNLKSLRMPKIQTIQFFHTILGPSTVVILNNPKLGEDFAKCIDGVADCVETENHSCRHDNNRKESSGRKQPPIRWIIIGGAALLVAVILIIIHVVCSYKKKKRRKEKSLKSDAKTTRKETTSQTERGESKTWTIDTSYSTEQSSE